MSGIASRLPTIILLHRGEKKHKCSIQALRGRPEILFLRAPGCRLPHLDQYVRLGLPGPPLTPRDKACGLLLVDANWRRADRMAAMVREVPVRSLSGWQTAYPRASKNSQDPAQGLATVEALFAALLILGRDPGGILEHYHWRELFLAQNRELIQALGGPPGLIPAGDNTGLPGPIIGPAESAPEAAPR